LFVSVDGETSKAGDSPPTDEMAEASNSTNTKRKLDWLDFQFFDSMLNDVETQPELWSRPEYKRLRLFVGMASRNPEKFPLQPFVNHAETKDTDHTEPHR